MNSKEIREQMAQIESAEAPLNLRPTEMDREQIRAQRQLTLAVLEVALQLATLQEYGLQNANISLENIDNAWRRQ